MFRNFMRVAGVTSLLLVVSACSNQLVGGETGILRESNSSYIKGESLPPLKVPASVVQLPPDPYFVIPDVPNQGSGPVSIEPPRV